MRLQYQTDHGRRYVKQSYWLVAFLLGAVPAATIRSLDASSATHALGWVLLAISQVAALAIRRRWPATTGLWVADVQPMRAGFRAAIRPGGIDGLVAEKTRRGHMELKLRDSTWSTSGVRRSMGPMAQIGDGDNANRLLVRCWTDGKASDWQPTGITWGDGGDDTFPQALARDIRERSAAAEHWSGVTMDESFSEGRSS